MIINQHKKPHSFRESIKRYEKDEGFSEDQCEHIIVDKQQTPDQKSQSRKIINKQLYAQPKLKLKLINHEEFYSRKIADKIKYKQELISSSNKYKSLEIKKKDLSISSGEKEIYTIIKNNRTFIGQNIPMRDYYVIQNKSIKQLILNNGGQIVYQRKYYPTTHTFFRMTYYKTEYYNQTKSFLKSKYNSLIKEKIKESFSKKQIPTKQYLQTNNNIQFDSSFECGNLQIAAKIGPKDYDLYMTIDTNTLGHQNWFYFKATNNSNDDINSNLRICNFKRELKIFTKGAKIYSRNITKKEGWILSGQNFILKQATQTGSSKRIYRLSFDFYFKSKSSYQISLLPPYSYSQMIKDIQQIENKPYVNVKILTYSLTGLSIPVITIGTTTPNPKTVTLITSRVHPGQTVGSLVVKGILNRLTDDSAQMSQFLKNNVIKIVPMVNPDGVVFGNFRTSFLGADLNRSFLIEDQVLYPEVYAIKQLGKKLKLEYKDHFNTFIDLHGHSSKKNIFAYGPEYDHNESGFYSCRLLPKILNSKSKYFKFSDCSFKLQEYKQTTARAYFIKNLGINSYTIEASYSLYDYQNKQINFNWDDWVKFGRQLVDGIIFTEATTSISTMKNHFELKKLLSTTIAHQQITLLKKIQKDIKKQSQVKQSNKIKYNEDVNSDGQNSCEDLNSQQRNQMQKKIIQTTLQHLILPKMQKQPIVYPTVTPKLFHVAQKVQNSSIKLLYTKRNKYCALRMMNVSNTSGNLINEICHLDALKPYVKIMKLQNRLDF